jgi:hypothetical protein
MPTAPCGTCGGHGKLGYKPNQTLCYKCGGSGVVETKSASAPNTRKGCFVATAAYGSAAAPEVQFLRNFRDEVLLTSIPGTWFVRCYYVVSPSIADVIAQRPLMRSAVRKALLQPLVNYLKQIK